MTDSADNTTKPSAIEQIRAQLDTTIVTRGRVVFIGLGGIGMYVSKTAATFLAGLQRAMPDKEIDLLLVDGDEFSQSNTYRMDVPEMGNKAEVLGREMLRCHDALGGFSVRWRPEYVTLENIVNVIMDGDLVFLAVDNHKTRKLVSDHCCGLESAVLISGGNDGVDEGLRGTYGNVQVFVKDGKEFTAPLTYFHPEIQNPADKSPHEMDCLEAAASGLAQISLANMTVASWMLNSLMRLMMPPKGERMWDEINIDIVEGVAVPNWLSGPKEIE